MSRPDRLRIMAGLAVVLVLSACAELPGSWTATVPTAGPIAEGDQVGLDRDGQFIRVIARGPQDGMTPMQIVEGFLEASASFDGDQAVARQFLTTEASRRWNPALGVAVVESEPVLSGAGAAITVQAVSAGAIDRAGTYSVAEDGTDLTARFDLVREAGQWRIADLPQGLILSSADVERAYRPLNIYFFDPSYTTLVPDSRLVPVLGSGAATSLVRMLLEGPSSWLAPAVRTAFPPGTALGVDAVPIEAGVAQVDLTTQAREADDATRQSMSAQLVWTLRQVPDVRAIAITTRLVPFDVPGVASPQPRDAWPEADPGGLLPGSTAHVVLGEGLVRLGAASDVAVPLSSADGGPGPRLIELAVSRTMDDIAGIDARGTLWRGPLRPGSPMVPLVPDCACTSPVFDRSGDVWTVVNGSGAVAFDETGLPTRIQVTGLPEGSQVAGIVPSRDGTRAALLVQSEAGTTLLLGRIVRTTTTSEARVSSPIRVESTLDEVLDVAWAGADSLAVLGIVTGSAPQAYDVDLARGLVIPIGAPDAPVSIAAAPGLPGLLSSADGTVSELRAGAWLPRITGTAPAYPS